MCIHADESERTKRRNKQKDIMPTLELDPYESIDALLVLGRGIDSNGELSETSRERSEIAIDIARILEPHIVMFSGGHSWQQELDGLDIPSEGYEMLSHAVDYIDDGHPLSESVLLLYEDLSTSTTRNMVNSKPNLGLERGSRLGILSDELHFSQGRVQYLAELVFPHVDIVPFQIPIEHGPGALREERLTTIMTRMAMTGVRAGSDKAIAHRQELLERGNATFRRTLALANRGRRAFETGS